MQIAQDIADAAVDAAVRAFPREYCAALLGSVHAESAHVTGILRVRNADGARGLFDISQAEALHVSEVARRRGIEVVAWLHSHPSGRLDLSEADKASLAHSDLPWVIVGCGAGPPGWAAYAMCSSATLPVTFAN